MNLYLTADTIGTETGGGKVTFHESEALKSLGPCAVWGRKDLSELVIYGQKQEPWKWDHLACTCVGYPDYEIGQDSLGLCHIYAGTFSNTVKKLQAQGTTVSITCAAHDIAASRKAHLDLGMDFPYPHLTNPELWKRYSQGYMDCDVLVCPSTVAAETCRKQGRTGRIEVIPHGCDIPKVVKPLPKRFTVGYMGSLGADKGIRYLLEAWKKLNYKDGSILVLAGKDSQSDWAKYLYMNYGGGGVVFLGWVKNISDFYNQISLYIQPSVTEGFGCEVLEAMVHSRPVLCSKGAGAQDLVPEWYRFDIEDSDVLATKIDEIKQEYTLWVDSLDSLWSGIAKNHTWDKIKQRYVALWKELLNA